MASGGGLTDLKPNLVGIDAVLSSGPVASMLRELAEPIAQRANGSAQVPGAEYRVYVNQLSWVPIAKVVPGNYKARVDNARNNTILKSR